MSRSDCPKIVPALASATGGSCPGSAGRERQLSGSESRHALSLLRQIHLPQESLVARIAAQAAKIGRNLEPRDAGISRSYRALSPLECLVFLTAPRIHAGDCIIVFLGDQLLKNSF